MAVLASEAFGAAAGDELAFLLVDKLAVKGRREPVRVYELLGIRAECAGAHRCRRTYEQALEAYFAREFDRPIALPRSRGDDPPSRVLLDRSEAMRRSSSATRVGPE